MTPLPRLEYIIIVVIVEASSWKLAIQSNGTLKEDFRVELISDH